MSVVASGGGVAHAEETVVGLPRVRLPGALTAATTPARRVLKAQLRGTLVLRTNDGTCRALKETGTIAAFALWNGPGM